MAAPRSTFDPRPRTAQAIPIEERSAEEVLSFAGNRVAPEGVGALHPAFDVTPARTSSAPSSPRTGPSSPWTSETVGKFLAKGDRMMASLAIETSCDDTSAAVLDVEGTVLSSVVSSQDEIHAPYGGVVPELASRQHLTSLPGVVAAALGQAGISDTAT